MRGRLLLAGNVAAFVVIADGLAMLVSRSTSTLGGAALLVLGGGWLLFALPRLVRPEVRPFLRVLIPKIGALALPILFLPVSGLWFVATPSALTVGFATAWVGLWLACLLATVVAPCPLCGGAYGEYITYGPDRLTDDHWNVEYVQFDFKGQKVEVGSGEDILIFDAVKHEWCQENLDFDCYADIVVLGKLVRVMDKQALMNYKRKLDREVDRADIEQIENA